MPSLYLKTHHPTYKFDGEHNPTGTRSFTSEVGIGYFADALLEHNKPYTDLILFVFLLKLQFALETF